VSHGGGLMKAGRNRQLENKIRAIISHGLTAGIPLAG
jgi:hypothetical protein